MGANTSGSPIYVWIMWKQMGLSEKTLVCFRNWLSPRRAFVFYPPKATGKNFWLSRWKPTWKMESAEAGLPLGSLSPLNISIWRLKVKDEVAVWKWTSYSLIQTSSLVNDGGPRRSIHLCWEGGTFLSPLLSDVISEGRMLYELLLWTFGGQGPQSKAYRVKLTGNCGSNFYPLAKKPPTKNRGYKLR